MESDVSHNSPCTSNANESECIEGGRERKLSMQSPVRFDFYDICTGITDRIPVKEFSIEKGLTSERVMATCLDVDESQIAVGTSVGNVHIFNRQQRKMFTIKGRDRIVRVKLSRNEDYALLAVGLCTGVIVMLQLPSSADGKSRKLLQKDVRDVHRCELTCLEWSVNGRKLFTGDSSGLVMMTLIDFENDMFDSSFIYCDQDHLGIVQLAYWGNFLSLCTVSRAYLVDIAVDCRTYPVGSHGKKNCPSDYGVAFAYDDRRKSDTRPDLYISRPGFRLWRSNLPSSEPASAEISEPANETILEVTETQDYQRSMWTAPSSPIPSELRDDTAWSASTGGLGMLHILTNENGQSDVLVTHSDRRLYLVDIHNRVMIGWAHFRHRIVSVSTCSKTGEIFILLSDNQQIPFILRISTTRADPWLITSVNTTKSGEIEPTVAMKELLRKVKDTSSKIVNKSADVWSIKDPPSTPNFQVCLNSLRASEEKGELTIDEFSDGEDIAARLGNDSPTSTPDTASLASGGGNSIPPWCLEDQSIGDNAPTCRVRVTKSKTGKRNKLMKITRAQTSQPAVGDELKLEKNDESNLTTMDADTAKLTTPTEETYSQNRFNPFDTFSTPKTPVTTRDELERMLDSTLFRQDPDPPVSSSPELEKSGEHVAVIQMESTDQRDDADSGSIPADSSCSDISSREHASSVLTSFRQLLLNEAKVATARRVEPSFSRLSSTSTSTEPLASPDDVPYARFPGASSLDIWCQMDHNRPVIYLTGTPRYLALVDVDQKCHYFSYSHNKVRDGVLVSTGEKEDAWAVLPVKADTLAVSPNGRIVWRVLDQVAYCQLKPSLHSPLGRKWCEAATDVSTRISVSNSSAWYLKIDGTICAQTQLRADRPCFKIAHIVCEWPLVQLACMEDVVWGLRQDGRLVVRIGIKLPDCPLGTDWIDFQPDGPSEVVALHLFEKTAWVLDADGELWFCRGVSNKCPIGTSGRWWQVPLPGPLSNSTASKRRVLPHAVCVTKWALYVAVDRSIWYCTGGMTGHRWSRVIPAEYSGVDQFRRICLSKMFDENSDHVWLTRANNEFMIFQPHSRRLQSLVAPCGDAEIVSVCGALGHVWTLDTRGRVFIRSGIDSTTCPLGSHWILLDMAQFESGPGEPVRLINISCGLDAVWACDQHGGVYVRLDVAPTTANDLPSAWLRLDDAKEAQRVKKLACSVDGSTVWAVTKTGRILVRWGITKDVPIGRGWTEVEDLRARTLAVSGDCVWALSENFELYQRYGITRDNPSGNFWKPLSRKLRSAAVTPVGRLWGLDMDGKLVKHQSKVYHGNPGETMLNDSNKSGSDGILDLTDFEVI